MAVKKMTQENKEEKRLTELKDGDIWTAEADWICVTTNGITKASSWAVMGAGVALQAEQKIRGCARELGRRLREGGNHVYPIGTYAPPSGQARSVYSFPTKYHWRDKSDLKLIRQSAQELLLLWLQHAAKTGQRPRVVLPKPGSGLGGLDYEEQVRPVLLEVFGGPETCEYFTVCT